MFLDKDRDAVFVVAGGYKIGGGTGGIAAICHGHAHAGVSHHAGVVVRIAKHADVLELHVVELRHAHKAARLGHARIHELVEPLRGLQSRRLNSVIGKRRRPLNHLRHHLGRHGKHHLGLRLAQELGKIDHLVGHAVDARQVLDARVALGHVEHAVSGADGRCRKVRHVLADARDGLARQRIAQLVDVVRAVDDLGATAAHHHVYQAFDAPELVHGLGRVGVAPGAQAKEHAALAQGADRRHGARGHRVLAREQRAVDIAEHGFDVAEGGVHGGPFWVVRRCGVYS